MRGYRRAARLGALLLIAALSASACSKKDEGPAAQAPSSVKARAGVNDSQDKTIAVLAMLPAEIKIKTGAEIEWTIAGPEPHSVTFFPPGQQPPTPDKAGPFFEPTQPKGPYDGTTLINSGLGPLGPTGPIVFKVTFSKAGSFTFVCVIHPQMTGNVSVGDDASADTQAALDSRAKSDEEKYLAEGRAAKKALTEATVKKTAGSGGTTTWEIQMGTSTAHTDILAFAPGAADIKAGDTITFVNNSTAPHTASFGGSKVPQDPESEAAMKPTGTSPATLNATDYFNTGWLPPNAPPGSGPPLAARSFSFKVPAAGTYNYVCILHVPSGMAGAIKAA